MAASRRFWIGFGTLLAVPAALAAPSSGDLAHALRYLPVSYLWLAFPQLVIALIAVSPSQRNTTLLLGLAGMDLVLMAFWLWVHSVVPLQESGLAWVLYIPLGIAELVLAASVGFVLRRLQARSTVGA